MIHTFRNKSIRGIITVLPEMERTFDQEAANYNFPVHQTMKLKKIMGYEKHRIVKDETTVSDLCIFGLNKAFEQGYLKKDEIDALILVTQCPDYFTPPTSNVIQGALGLRKDMICMDINQGCAGYVLGLMQAFLLLDMGCVQKVALLNADVLSRKISNKDRNSYPLTGDAAAITIVENSSREDEIYFNLYMDGEQNDVLIIPAGGFRTPSSEETARLTDVGDGNLRSKDHLIMDGAAVFTFVQKEVPPMIRELLNYANLTDSDIDYYLCHQPNKFMLEKLAERMGIRKDKMPMNIVTEYGNSSGCTIPVNICRNLGSSLKTNTYKCCMAGFGSGLTWSSMIMDLGDLEFIETFTAEL